MDGGKHIRWDCNFFGRLIWSYNWLILILINFLAYHQNNIIFSWFHWSTWISTADNLCRKFEVEAGRAGNINGLIHTNKGQLPPAFRYRGIHEKSSGDVVSAVCYTICAIYLSLFTQTAETTSPEPFSEKRQTRDPG